MTNVNARDVGVKEEDEFTAASQDRKSVERDALVLYNAHRHARRYTHAQIYLLLISKWHVKRAEEARWDGSLIRFTHMSSLVTYK